MTASKNRSIWVIVSLLRMLFQGAFIQFLTGKKDRVKFYKINKLQWINNVKSKAGEVVAVISSLSQKMQLIKRV